MRIPPLFLALPILGGCSLGNELAGDASVGGRVTQSSGLPLGNSAVVADCAGGVGRNIVSIDSAGWYTANLTAPATGRIRCTFAVPDLANARIRVDTVIGFGPSGQLHPLQVLNLHETTTP